MDISILIFYYSFNGYIIIIIYIYKLNLYIINYNMNG